MFWAKASFRIMTRRRLKSLVIIIVSLVLVLFINMYAETIVKHQTTLKELHSNIKVTGIITRADGTGLDDLDINDFVIGQLEASGFIARGLYTRNLRCMQGPFPQLEPLYTYNALITSPKLVGATEISAISAFAHEGARLPQYMDGYDQGLFSSKERVCIVSEGFLKENALVFGDELQLTVAENSSKVKDVYCHGTVTLKIVGTYQSDQIHNAPLYCPWEVITDIYQDIGLPLTWDSARFIFCNTERLNEFKALLMPLGFLSHRQISEMETIGKDRLGFIINDSLLTDATASIAGYIELSRILYPVIYMICAGIGFIVSYLLVRLRKPEFAIMRSLGTSKAAGFLTFFIEQALLTIIGTGLGIILTLVLTQEAAANQYATIACYLACYLVGAAIAISTLNRVNVIQILTAKE